MPNGLTRQQFAQSIKTKYPQYAQMEDEQLVTQVIAKHPQYESQLAEPAAPQANQASMGGGMLTGAMETVKNIPGSAAQFAKDITAPIHSPVQTAKGIGGLAKGLVQMLAPGEQGSEENVRNVGRFLAERYGGMDEILKTLRTDPVGIAADIGGLLTGGAGLAVKGAATAGRVAAASRATGRVGRALQSGAQTAGAVARRAGDVAKQAGRAIDPARAAAKVGSAVGRGAGNAVAEVLGLTTGATATPIKVAFEAGREGGGRMFAQSMRGKVPLDDVVEQAREALGNMHKRKMSDYREGISKAFSGRPARGNTTSVLPEEAREAISWRRAEGEYYPRRFEPIHEVKDWEKVERIVKSALDGNEVQPFLIDGNPGNGNLLTGTHRAAANDILRDLGETEIPFVSLDDLPPQARNRINEYVEVEDFRSHGIDDVFDEIYPKTKPVTTDTAATPLDFGRVAEQVQEATSGATFKGQDISRSTAQVRSQIGELFDRWGKLDPAQFHTVEGLDALRKAVGDVMDSTEFGTPARRTANQVYAAVRKAVSDQAPGYADALKQYHEATNHLRDLERDLSLGNKAATATALRKLQAVMREDVASAYGARAGYARELEGAGAAGLREGLAGQAMSTLAPRGLARGVAGAGAGAGVALQPAMLPLLAGASPRLVGEASLLAGRGSGKLAQYLGQLPSVTPQISFQAGRAGRVQ